MKKIVITGANGFVALVPVRSSYGIRWRSAADSELQNNRCSSPSGAPLLDFTPANLCATSTRSIDATV